MCTGLARRATPGRASKGESMAADEEAPGWSAIEAALTEATGGVAPLHWGTGNLPDQDGPYGLNAYGLEDHWLLLTLGLSELFSKVTDDPSVSGWGIELTMRVPRTSGDEAPPTWALNLLNKLGGYVYQSGRVLEAGHRMNPGGPITGQQGTGLTGLVFAADPQVPDVSTPFGSVELIAVVGVTADELSAAQQEEDAADVIAALAQRDPLLVTDPGRS
jgi:hypothetical protein